MSQNSIEFENSFDTFICYETLTGIDYAKNLKESLLKMDKKAFVAKEDLITGMNNEEEIRYSVIKNTPIFILIMTQLALTSSPEVEKEINKALEYDRKIIVCLQDKVDVKTFKNKFSNISKKQRITFDNKYDLADQITSSYNDFALIDKSLDNNKIIDIPQEEKTGLIINPRWSIDKINRDNNEGHIIFDVENRTGNKIIIHGYRMYRISPEGVKDVFWKGTSKKPNEFNRWVSDPHTNQILWNEEKHTFNWNDTNLIEDYGINKKGKWKTEVKIAYFEENSNTLSSAVGETYIDFE